MFRSFGSSLIQPEQPRGISSKHTHTTRIQQKTTNSTRYLLVVVGIVSVGVVVLVVRRPDAQGEGHAGNRFVWEN